MAGFYNCLIFWNGYIVFTVHVVFVGRLVCVNILCMELSYTGSFGRLEHQSMSQFKLVLPVTLRMVLLIVSFLFGSLFN